VKTDVGGCARYEDDYYHQVSQDLANVPGNPWFICTMWLAQYEIASARGDANLKEAVKILEWVADHALPSGALAEQVHPYTNEPLSVSPLTWSHATFVTVVLEYLEKRRVLMAENVMDHTILPV
jgi:glucoamylase